jgi:DNA polymerase beta thumb/Zinc finger, C3HC4 type (RING finger)
MSNWHEHVKNELAKLAKELRCPICLDLVDDAMILPCTHIFCKECLRLGMAHKSECPTCRTPAAPRESHRMVGYENMTSWYTRMKDWLDSHRAENDAIIQNEQRNEQHLNDADEQEDDDEQEVLNMFTSVPSVSPAIAAQWYFNGCRTFDDVLERGAHSDDAVHDELVALTERCSRTLIDRCAQFVCNALLDIDVRASMLICGRYRRGGDDLRALHVLVWPADAALLGKLDALLRTWDFFDGESACSVRSLDDGIAQVRAVGRYTDQGHTWLRRVRIVACTQQAFATAAVWCTGSEQYWRRLQTFAARTGKCLSAGSLTSALNNKRISVSTEREVFGALGISFVAPSDRSIANCASSSSSSSSRQEEEDDEEDEDEDEEEEETKKRERSNVELSRCEHIVIVGTALNERQKDVLRAFKAMVGSRCRTRSTMGDTVTHVVTAASGCNRASRTLKYFLAILSGAWVLSFDWLRESVAQGAVLAEQSYEITSNTEMADAPGPRLARLAKASANGDDRFKRLFDSLDFVLLGKFAPPEPPKKDLTELLRAGGARILTNSNAADASSRQVRAVVAENCQVPSSLSHVIALPCSRLFNAIARYKLNANE